MRDTLQAFSWQPRGARSTTTTTVALVTLKPEYTANRAKGMDEKQALHSALCSHLPEYAKATQSVYKVHKAQREVIVSWVQQ